MDPTEVYARLDDDGTLYLRATEKDGYTIYSNSRYWKFPDNLSTQDVKIIAIEEEIAPSTATLLFYNYINLTEIRDIKKLHTENITSMDDMFCNCSSLKFIDLSRFDTSSVKNMNEMFYGCRNLINLDLDSFDTSNVENMGFMFAGCKFEKIDLTSLDTSKVRNMSYMFDGCSNLTDLNLTNFNTSNVTSIHRMFQACSSLKKLDISSFNTSNVTDMFAMAHECLNLTTVNLGKNFIINTTQYGYVIPNNNDIKIRAIQSTADKIKNFYSNLTDDNFEIIKEQ